MSTRHEGIPGRGFSLYVQSKDYNAATVERTTGRNITVDRNDVIAFLDWLTASGNEMQYAIINPTGAPGETPTFYRNDQPVTADDMNRWANTWLADTGRESTGPIRAWLIREALQIVMDEHVYPRTH
jgi:hypothetical protein